MTGSLVKHRVRRVTNPAGAMSDAQVTAQRESEYLKYVTAHPDYHEIVKALKAGRTVKSIVRWLESDNRLNGTTVSVLTSALYEFRSTYRHMFTEGHAADTLEGIISHSDQPTPDTATELAKLYEVQKRRIAVDTRTEIAIGKLLPTTHKEIQVAINILDKLEQVKGGNVLNDDAVSLSKKSSELPTEVRSELVKLKLEEHSKDKLTAIVSQFARHLHGNAKTDKKS